MTVYTASAGTGKYTVHAEARFCGSDLAVTICGGTRWHAGAVAIAWPEEGNTCVRTISAPTHRDDVVAAWAAKHLSATLHCNVAVTAGIHIDDASQEEIAMLVTHSQVCCQILLEQVCQSL